MLYPNMKKSWGYPFILKNYNGCCVGIFLAIICYVLIKLARAYVHLERTPIPLSMVMKCFTWYQIVGKIMKITIKETKNDDLMLRTVMTRENAHFSEMLKMA